MTGRIGPYQVLGLIGEGGMGQVLRALDPKLQREVAIKVLSPALVGNARLQERFQRELQALLSLRAHPNIVTVFDFVEQPFAVVMELLQGQTLQDILARERGIQDPVRALKMFHAIVSAVGFAHENGILHRDIKSANVMVVRLGSQEVIKVMDFGLCGFVGDESGLTRAGTRMGTPAYMPPEQHLGHGVDGRSDIYSLGILLFEMVTGRLPFDESRHTDYELMRAHIEEPMPSPATFRPDLPRSVVQVILHATQKRPEQRFQSCQELLAAIEALQRGQDIDYGHVAGAPIPPSGSAAPRDMRTIVEDAPHQVRTSEVPRLAGRRKTRLGLWLGIAGGLLGTVSIGLALAFGIPSRSEIGGPCAEAKDCKTPLICRGGKCYQAPVHPACIDLSDCRGNESCVHGECKLLYPYCADRSACRLGEICTEGRCMAEFPMCRETGYCPADHVCRDGRCLKDWHCLCMWERESRWAPCFVNTVCRENLEACQVLERATVQGTQTICPNSLVRSCRSFPADHPGDVMSGRHYWTPSQRPGCWQSQGNCLIP